MSTVQSPTPLRRWALLAVVANVALALLAALVLPPHARALLPIVGLSLPLLTTGVLDAALERRAGEH